MTWLAAQQRRGGRPGRRGSRCWSGRTARHRHRHQTAPVTPAMVAGLRHLVLWDDLTEWLWWRSLTEQEQAEAHASAERADELQDIWTAWQLGYTVDTAAPSTLGEPPAFGEQVPYAA